MRSSPWSPSSVPTDDDTVYLVADDFGKIRRCWLETDMETADLETVRQAPFYATRLLARERDASRPEEAVAGQVEE
jgi:hypothetical protein